MSRVSRKMDHVRYALSTGQARTHGFEDVRFVHQSIPDSRIDDINLNTRIGELSLSSPILINAMTGGGGDETLDINRGLARAAKECNIAMSVGSQMSAIKDPTQRPTYKIAREENPNGIIIGNLGSEATVEEAKLAVDMIQADALQIHLNVIQELVMPEGDRDFTGVLKRLEEIVNGIDVPVIVKEVGFGFSSETVEKLINIGIDIIDVGGFGGTNFAKVENERRETKLDFFEEWGILTAPSIVEVRSKAPFSSVIGSGGIQTAFEAAKAIALGASATAFAGYFLRILLEDGEDCLISTILRQHEQLKVIMTAIGVKDIPGLQKAPIVISGETNHWLTQRGIDTKRYSCRKL